LAVVLCAAAGCGRAARAPRPGTGGTPLLQYRTGQQVAVYEPAQVRAAERSLGFPVVEPTLTVRLAAGLRLSEVIVTQLSGTRVIHYVYGSLTSRWVFVMEAREAAAAPSYDPASEEVVFGARGCGIIVTTNLPTAVLDRIVHRLGGPADATRAGG
jgi:anti-sigma factor RsiW